MLAPTATAAPHSKHQLRRLRPRPDRSRDAALIANLAAFLDDDPAAIIAFVWPLGDEPDLRPLMDAFDAAARPIVLPVVVAPGQPLEFRAWHVDAEMQSGPYGTRHPVPSQTPRRPDIILVPLLAFDRRRNRLGRGGGFYDRTLAAHRQARAVGFAHATAEIADVPNQPHDIPLDAIVTDRESF